MRTGQKRIVLWLTILAAIILSYGYGFSTIQYHIFPYNQIQYLGNILATSNDVNEPAPLIKEGNTTYLLPVYRRSYFKLTDEGALELIDSLPYQSEGIYYLERVINSNESAIIVMDPWIDMVSEHLNDYYGQITESNIAPLVQAAQKRGHPVIVLTNNCNGVKYNCKINNQLQQMIDEERINVIFHQDMDDDQFADYLKAQGIKSLFYTGFASNMCVTGRKMGMIPMKLQGFQLYFIPEASAAVEDSNSWADQSTHKATTKIISQWIGEVVDYNSIMHALSAN